jgi:hypothetical protein
LQAVTILPCATKWHATRCPTDQKASTKDMQIGLCILVVLISDRGVEDLCWGKKVPWQLAALIEDHKYMEVWRTLVVYICRAWVSHCRAKAHATLSARFCEHFLGLVTLSLANSSYIIVSKNKTKKVIFTPFLD